MFILTAEDFKKAKITIFLISINLIFFISFNLALGNPYFLLLAQINYKIIENYEFWRLFTAMFLHGDVLHIFSNMLSLLLFGAFIENYFSKLSYIVLYLLSGLIGNLFSLFLLPIDSISLGASGCIFGLIGATIISIMIHDDKSILFLGLLYLGYFLLSSFNPGINYLAHIFGLLGGLIMGYFLIKRKPPLQNY